MRFLEILGELSPPLVPDVHCRGRRLRPREEPPLRLEVLLHRAVQVEVVLAQVREHEHVEAYAVETAQRGPVRARLDGRAAIARVEHLPEEALEVDCLRSRERRRTRLASNLPLDRPDEPRASTGRFEDRAEQERRRRLAVRPRHARELELLRRLAEESIGGNRHRLAHGGNEQLRDVDLERSLDDDGCRTALDRLPREIVAVDTRPAHAEEQRARRDASCVIGEVGDLDRLPPGHFARRESRHESIQLHAGRLEKAVEAAQRVLGASCGISRCCRLKRAISRNAGAATTPP